MQRKALRDRVRFLSLIEPHEVSDDELDGLLNEGYNTVLTRAEWPWSLKNTGVNVRAGHRSYEIGSEGTSKAATVVGIYREDGSHLRSMSTEQALRFAGTERSSPTMFTVTHEEKHFRVTLIPEPDRDEFLEVVYRGGMIFDPGDTAEPPWHFAFHEMLADFAIYRVWEREEDLGRSEQYRARFELRLTEMLRFYNQQTEDRPRIFGEFPRPYPGVGVR